MAGSVGALGAQTRAGTTGIDKWRLLFRETGIDKDAEVLLRHIREGEVKLKSKNVVVSREYMPIVAQAFSTAQLAGMCRLLRHLFAGRVAFVLARSMDLACMQPQWHPARGAAQEATDQMPVQSELVQNAQAEADMHAFAEFIGRHFDAKGTMIRIGGQLSQPSLL